MTVMRTSAAINGFITTLHNASAANDVSPFEGTGAGDWGDQWIDHRLRALCHADERTTPTPRLAELMRRLEASLERDRQA